MQVGHFTLSSLKVVLLLLLLLLLDTQLVVAQQTHNLRIVASAPSGGCLTNDLRVVRSTGHMYSCTGGTWIDVTPISPDVTISTAAPTTCLLEDIAIIEDPVNGENSLCWCSSDINGDGALDFSCQLLNGLVGVASSADSLRIGGQTNSFLYNSSGQCRFDCDSDGDVDATVDGQGRVAQSLPGTDGTRGVRLPQNSVTPTAPTDGRTCLIAADNGRWAGMICESDSVFKPLTDVVFAGAGTSCTAACPGTGTTCADAYSFPNAVDSDCSNTTGVRLCDCAQP